MMQAIDITRHSRITQQLVPSTTALSFVCYSQFARKKKVAHDFRYDPRTCGTSRKRNIKVQGKVQKVVSVHEMKVCGGVEIQLRPFLISALDGGY